MTFVLRERGAGAGAGYVSSGFFGGLTVGRMALIWVNRKVRVRGVKNDHARTPIATSDRRTAGYIHICRYRYRVSVVFKLSSNCTTDCSIIRLELTIWLIPSLYENAVAVSLVGVALGPFYPIVMNAASVLLPRR